MPELPKPPKGKKGKGGARIFGFPWYVVAGGVVAAIALGLYLRHRSTSSGSAGTTAAPAQDTSGGAGGGSSSPTDAPAGQQIDLTGLQNSIDELSSLLSYGPASLGDPGLGAAPATAPTSPYAFTPGSVSRQDTSYGYVWPTSTPGIGTGVGVDLYGTPTSYSLLGPSAPAGGYNVNQLYPNVGEFGKITLAPSKSPVSHPPAQVPPAPSSPAPHPTVAKTYSFAYPTTDSSKLALSEHRAPPGGF